MGWFVHEEESTITGGFHLLQVCIIIATVIVLIVAPKKFGNCLFGAQNGSSIRAVLNKIVNLEQLNGRGLTKVELRLKKRTSQP